MTEEPKCILEALKKRGFTLYKISKETGIHQTTLSRWLNGEKYHKSMAKILKDYYSSMQ